MRRRIAAAMKASPYRAGQLPEDLLDCGAEAHLQELIGFVEHERVQLRHVTRHPVVLQEIEKPNG